MLQIFRSIFKKIFVNLVLVAIINVPAIAAEIEGAAGIIRKQPMNTKTTRILEAENYISKMMSKKVPYEVTVQKNRFVVRDHSTYPPGKLTEMWNDYLAESKAAVGKTLLDVGCGAFSYGIIAASNGAKHIIGTDISEEAIETAKNNIKINNIDSKTKVTLLQGAELDHLFPSYSKKIDIVFGGLPWDTISKAEFDKIPEDRKPLSLAFYDVEDALITSLLLRGFELLNQDGKILITASERVMPRISALCKKHDIAPIKVFERDLHNDGNMHYILELRKLYSE